MLLKQMTLENSRGKMDLEVYSATIMKIDIDHPIGAEDKRLEDMAVKIEAKESSNCIDFVTAQLSIFNARMSQRIQDVKSFYRAEFLEDLIGKAIKLVMLDGKLIALGSPIVEKYVTLCDEMPELLSWDDLKTWLSLNTARKT